MHVLSSGVSLAIFTVLFGMMFKILPDAYIAWRYLYGRRLCDGGALHGR